MDTTFTLGAFLGDQYPPPGFPGPSPPPNCPPLRTGRVESYSNTGCKGQTARSYPDCGDDKVELTVPGPGTLHVVHRNASYSCCLDIIVVSLAVQGEVLRLSEVEVLTTPCDCMCCYDVEATAVDVEPGTYTVEFCWQDYELGREVCHVEEVTIP